MSEDRITQGGELPVDSQAALDGVVVDAPAEEQVTQQAASTDLGEPFALDASLLYFFEHAILTDDGTRGMKGVNRLQKPYIKKIVKALGSDFFFLKALGMHVVQLETNEYQSLSGDLKMDYKIPGKAFFAGLQTFFGEEDANFLLATDIGQELGLDDLTTSMTLTNNAIQNYVPELSHITELESTYFIPRDPQLLLLLVEPEFRRFLSACIEYAGKTKRPPFSNLPINDLRYNNADFTYYCIPTDLSQDYATMPFLDLATIVHVGAELGITQLKPYLEKSQEITKKIKEGTGY